MGASSLLSFFQPPVKQPGSSNSSIAAFAGQPDRQESKVNGRKFADMVKESADPRDTSARDAANDRAQSRTATNSRTSPKRSTGTSASDDIAKYDTVQPYNATREITPEEAAEILASPEKLSALLGQLSGDPEAENAVKEQLTQIVSDDTSKTVGELFAEANLPEPQPELPQTVQADLPTPQPTDIPQQPAASITMQATLAHTAQRVLHLFNKALSTPSEEPSKQPVQAEVGLDAINPALFALQTAPFQAADATAQTAQAETAAAQTVTLVTPLSQAVAIASYTTVASAEVDDVASADLPKTPDIDSRIPSLALVKDQTALPEVTLPKAKLAARPVDPSASASPTTPAPITSADAIARQLETLGTTAKSLGLIKEEAPVELKTIAAVTPQAITMGAAIPVQPAGPHAIAPAAGVIGQGITNHAPVTSQVFVSIARAAKDGIDQITVQLDPIEMGRIEVKLRMGKDGHTQLAFIVDRPETFDALSRDARMLEQSLQEAGIKADTSGMQFNLRQQPQPQPQFSGDMNGRNGQSGQSAAADTAAPRVEANAAPASDSNTYRLDVRDGVDIEA